jgi:hypothetical protein
LLSNQHHITLSELALVIFHESAVSGQLLFHPLPSVLLRLLLLDTTMSADTVAVGRSVGRPICIGASFLPSLLLNDLGNELK